MYSLEENMRELGEFVHLIIPCSNYSHLERVRYFRSGNACFCLPSLFWSVIKESKGFLGQYFPLEWKLDAGVYMNVVVSIIYYFVGMTTRWEKAYIGTVEFIFEIVHLLTCSTIFFRAGVANSPHSCRLALQNRPRKPRMVPC